MLIKTLGIVSLLLLINGCSLHDNPQAKVYDANRSYYLPYEYNAERFLIQGYFGMFSHSGYELDFVMPVGTFILASKAGQVVSVVESEDGNCPFSKDCNANFVLIRHSDGTLAAYVHIKQNGACVEVDQQVERGDVIALSGNVGISLLPHLHLSIIPYKNENEVPAFADIDQKGSGIPTAGLYYRSANTLKRNFCEEKGE